MRKCLSYMHHRVMLRLRLALSLRRFGFGGRFVLSTHEYEPIAENVCI